MASRKKTSKSPPTHKRAKQTQQGRPTRPASAPAKGRARYAVVGLGHIAQGAVLPAFAHAKRNSELVALVSDSPRKRRELAKKYRLDIAVDYDKYDELLASGDIDAVYIALPNSMHRDFTVRALEKGVHVLCEKPMATNSRECREMIEAAKRHNRRLMIAYRLHFDPANLEAAKIVRAGKLGEPRIFNSNFCMQVRPDNIRTDAEMGGGPLWDIGIYCLNAARYLFAAEPTHVFATNARPSDDPRFQEVPEMVSAVLHFPDQRLASFTCSFGAFDTSAYTVIGTKGRLTVDPAYEYAEALAHELTVGKKTTKKRFPRADQFAPELLHFSECIQFGREPQPSGREGANDVMIIEAMRRSMRTGRVIEVRVPAPEKRPEPEQAKKKPPVGKTPKIEAESASVPMS